MVRNHIWIYISAMHTDIPTHHIYGSWVVLPPPWSGLSYISAAVPMVSRITLGQWEEHRNARNFLDALMAITFTNKTREREKKYLFASTTFCGLIEISTIWCSRLAQGYITLYDVCKILARRCFCGEVESACTCFIIIFFTVNCTHIDTLLADMESNIAMRHM